MFNRKYHHCGPFNSIKPASGPIDNVCRDHDLEYGKLGKQAYWKYNNADEQFIKDMEKYPGWRPALYSSYFKLKKKIAPSMYVRPTGLSAFYGNKKRTGSDLVSTRSRNTPFTGQAGRVTGPWTKFMPPTPPKENRLVAVGAQTGSSYRLAQSSKKKQNKMSRPPRIGGLRRRGGRVVRSRRSTRKAYSRKGKKSLKYSQGVTSSSEVTFKIQDLNCLYVGHTTAPQLTIMTNAARAAVKEFWKKEGIIVDDNGTLGPPVNTTFTIWYYENTGSTSLSSNSSITLAPSVTFANYVNAVQDLFSTVAGVSDMNWQFVKMTWYTAQTDVLYRFNHQVLASNLKFVFQLKSEICIQNTTESNDASTSVEVNTVTPLSFKHYSGKGNGTFYRNRSSTGLGGTYASFIGDPSVGAIQVLASDVPNQVLNEPPTPKFFMATKGGKKQTVSPGVIMKKKLSTNFTTNLTGLMRMYCGSSAIIKQKWAKGAFEFFGIEKVLNINSASGIPSTIPIEVDVQIQLDTRCAAFMKKHEYALPFNSTNAGINIV